MDFAKDLCVVLLLPAIAAYLAWLAISAVRSGQAYFPRIGYYSAKRTPPSFWAIVLLNAGLAIAFAVGWFYLVIEFLDHWR
jgi:hypothetical protein